MSVEPRFVADISGAGEEGLPDRILIVGTHEPESLEASYARAFARLGCDVDTWDPITVTENLAWGGPAGRLFGRFVRVETWLRKANADLLERVGRTGALFVVVIGTTGLRPGSLAQLRVLNPRLPIYCVFPDSPHSLDADRLGCLPLFTRVTVSSPAWVDAMARLGACKVGCLPFAADTLYHFPSSDRNRHSVNLGFIGTWKAEREAILETLSDLGLRVWGSDHWRRRTRPGSPLRSCWSGGPAVGQAFAEACSATRVMLNILDVTSRPGPNMRAFELARCHAFALTERTAAFTEVFPEGKASECFASADEARDKASFFLKNDTAREKIAAEAHAIVTEGGHTYLDRAKTLLAWVEEDQAHAHA